tara:strand:+ start:216 stop:626 length:411 start_codon:yes stop_codon:yes gene_type:complete
MRIIQQLVQNPKKIFLVDAIGALITAIFMLYILSPLQAHIGMPLQIITGFGIAALGLFAYSIFCHLQIKTLWRPFLFGVIALNSTYVVVSIILVLMYINDLTTLGIIYFIIEILIIIGLITIEYRTFKHLKPPMQL